MLARFTHPDMAAIWETENKFRIWLEIETQVAEAQAKLGIIPSDAAQAIREKGAFDIARVDEIETEVRHDVIAFLTCVSENIGEHGRWLHQGLTSSDVIDTGFSLQLKEAAELIIVTLDDLLDVLSRRVREHKSTLCIGRSHGIHAEPTTFGLKLAGHYAAFKRARQRIVQAQEEVSVCALSGAVGTFATIDPRIQKAVSENLGLKEESVSTQIIPRDRHAMFFATLAVIASSIENLSTEIRHLQRTEVREAFEYFEPGQKGSSAMPHKKNPILTENLTGLARLIRSAVTPALEDVTLWHERDISHSSVERVIAPDATILTHFALRRLTGVIDKLLVYPERMRQNLDSLGGLVFSQGVLLALTQSGMKREDAYRVIQHHALKIWDKGGDFLDCLQQDGEVTALLSSDKLQSIFDYTNYTRHIDDVIEKALAS